MITEDIEQPTDQPTDQADPQDGWVDNSAPAKPAAKQDDGWVDNTGAPAKKTWADKMNLPTSSSVDPLGIGRRFVDFAQGVAGGFTKTLNTAAKVGDAVSGGPVVRSVLDLPRAKEIPVVDTPENVAGKIGKGAEQVAEFMLPMGVVSKATAGMGLAGRALAEGAAAGGVSALQTGGDPLATVLGAGAGAVGPVAGSAVDALAQSRLPSKLYQSALKPTWSMVKKQGLKMLDTGLQEQIPVSAEGLGIVEDRIRNIQKEISDGIQAHAAQGRTVDSQKVLGALDSLEDFYKNTAAPKEALDTLDGIRKEFEQYHGQSIPLDKAQQIKINTYQELKKSYGQMATAKIEGLKQVARGLKEEISSVFPEISDLNEKQSDLLGLDEAMYRAVWRIENHQMMGIGSPLAAAAGHALMGGPGAVVGFVGKLLLDDPGVKSKLALALSRQGVKNAPALVGLRMSALKAMLERKATAIGAGKTDQ